MMVVLIRLLWPWLSPNFSQPQAFLVLGGHWYRELYAAELAVSSPELPIWVTGGSNPEFANYLFQGYNIAPDRVHLDYRAVDTVTNFTTMVDELQRAQIKKVYLITSNDHMRRALWIGRIVLGSRGIRMQPLSVVTAQTQEPLSKAVRDAGRSVLWLLTGRTGADVGHAVKQQRRLANIVH